MSLVRVTIPSKELAGYVPTLPLDQLPADVRPAIEQAMGSAHVTPVFAFAVGVDMLGLQLTMKAVKATPAVVSTWVQLLEDYGWGNNLRTPDLQLSMLANAIKAMAQAQNAPDALRLEGIVYNLIVEVCEGDQAVSDYMTKVLITDKGMTLPWALAVPPL